MPKVKTTCAVCGKEIYRWPFQLKSSRPVCGGGCRARSRLGIPPPNKADLVGQTFNRLTVVAGLGVRNGHCNWLCRCSCGNLTEATTGMLRYGSKKSCGCIAKATGESHWNWKRGFTVNQSGYREIPREGCKGPHRYRPEHRAVAEKAIGRELRPDEVVHHVNGDKTDNRPENLRVMTRSEHAHLHAMIRRGLVA